MGKILKGAQALVFLFLAGTAWATNTPARKLHGPDAGREAGAARLLQQAYDDLTHNDTAAAQAELDKAIQSGDFDELPSDLRYQVLMGAGLIAQQNGQNEKAHGLIVRATAFDAADDAAWAARLSTAFAIANWADAGHSLAVFAGHWPEKLDEFRPQAIAQLHSQLQSADPGTDQQMLDALFDAGWQVQEVEPSDWWRDLALMHLEHHDIARATTVALRITSGQTALSMLVDKRFDPITRPHPKAFDVARLVAAEIESAKARIKAHPDKLEPVYELQGLYLLTGQYSQVFSISDAAVAHAEHGDGDKTYTDFADRYIWILDNRFRALEDQGRWAEAERVEKLAARHPENGSMNVSQLINLGTLYADLNQPDEAANAIIELGKMSDFGRMQLEAVKLRIAIEKKDDAAIAAAMTYMREHRNDDIRVWEDALLLRGQLDAAAALLIERLQDPDWRNGALVDMQHYDGGDVAEMAVQKTIEERWDTITARPDVQAAMEKVGRVEEFHITSALR